MSANAVKPLQLPSSPESPIRRLTPFHLRVIFSPAQPNRPHPPKPPDPPDPPDLVPSRTQLPTFVLRYPSPATDPNLPTHPSPSLKSRDFLSIPDCLSFLVIYAVVKLVCCQHAARSELFSVHHRRSLSPLLWLRLRFLRQSAQRSAPMCSSAESAPATISQSFRHLMKPSVTLLTGGSPYNSVDPVNAHFEAHPVTSLSSLRGRDSSDVTPDRKLHSPMVQTYFTSDRIINMGQTQKLHTNWSPSRNLNVFISFHQTMKGLTQPFSYGKALQHSSPALERSLAHSSLLR